MSASADAYAAGAALPDAVRWYEGMRLAPQHFQQQSARLEMLAPALLRTVQPLHWGLLHLQTRQSGTVVTVTEIEAVMPDGLLVSGRPDQPLSIDLSKCSADPDGLWRLSLAVPARSTGERPGPRRYLDQGSMPVHDQNPGGVAATVSLLRPNLQLVCGHGQGFASEELLPLLRFQDNGALPLQTGYIAPWLRIAPGQPLYQRIDLLRRNLRLNYVTLANEHCNDLARQVRRQAILPLLAARLLELEAVYQDGTAHPQRLFQLLAGLLGALSAGVPGLELPRLASFDYRDMALAMEPLLAELERVRKRLAPDYHWASFSARGAHDHEIEISQVAAAEPYVIALQKPAGASDIDMAHWLKEALICSAGKESDLQRRRSRGIGKVLLSVEQAQRIGGDSARTLFQLDLSGDAHESFDPGATLRILGPGGSADNYVPPRTIELLLRSPTPGAGEPQ
ncbi:MAG TPA: type VI secretion system baseplate subunit TssK [Telluria sp.]|jgi:type VI secretion system protein ImpJ